MDTASVEGLHGSLSRTGIVVLNEAVVVALRLELHRSVGVRLFVYCVDAENRQDT